MLANFANLSNANLMKANWIHVMKGEPSKLIFFLANFDNLTANMVAKKN